jgi:hypothetical protein
MLGGSDTRTIPDRSPEQICMNAPVNSALALAAECIPVFPCGADKRPVTAHGFHAATRDVARLRAMFARPGAALIGVPTGAASGIVVLDGDVTETANGRATLREWTAAGRLPRTRTHETRRGGVHLLFRADPEHPLRSGTGRLAPAVDTRGEGTGYFIWWPAHGGRVLHDVPLADLPPVPRWVIEAVAAPVAPPLAERRSEPPAVPNDRYLAAALRRAVERVGAAGEGQRNTTLNAEAFALGRLIGAGLSAQDMTGALLAAAQVAGLPEHEALQTIRSAIRARGAA